MTDKQLRKAIQAQIEKYKENRFVKILITALGICAICLILAYITQEDMLPNRKTETEIKTTFDNTPMLYTLECEAQTIVTQKGADSWSWLGDRDFIIPVKGYIKAGYDLRKIKKIKIDGDVLSFTMPDPVIELQNAEPLYNQAVSKVGFFRSDFTQKEQSTIIKEGVELLKKRIEQLDLVPQAEEQARTIMESLVRQLGYQPAISFPTYNERNIKRMIKLGSELTQPKTKKKP
jgi:hypothetical protein